MEEQYANIKQEELHPTYQVIAQVVGLEATLKLGREFGRTTIYFPDLVALTDSRRTQRDKKIAQEYESGQYTKEQLGRKYKLSATGITDAIKRAKACSATSEEADANGSALIEQIKQALGELDNKGRHEVFKYVMKRKNSST